MNLNGTDRITVLYNFILIVFAFIFREKNAAYARHLACNLSVVLVYHSVLFEKPAADIRNVRGC